MQRNCVTPQVLIRHWPSIDRDRLVTLIFSNNFSIILGINLIILFIPYIGMMEINF